MALSLQICIVSLLLCRGALAAEAPDASSRCREGCEPEDDATSLMQVGRSQATLRQQTRDAAPEFVQPSLACKYGDGWRGWRKEIPEILSKLQLDPSGDIYEFGVWNGGSMTLLQALLPATRMMWGFDSFKGLPEQTAADLHQKGYSQGDYASHVTPDSLTSLLGGPTKAGMIAGYYNESLTPELKKSRGMGRASFVDIDADLYMSSFQALDWLFDSGLVGEGTLIGYDDWWVNACSKGGEHLNPLTSSEGKAHKEIGVKHNVQFRCVNAACRFVPEAAKCPHGTGAIFMVERLGANATPQHGFEMTNHEVSLWKTMNPTCQRFLVGSQVGVHAPSNNDPL